MHLTCWRIARRFGTKAQVVFVMAAWGPGKEQYWFSIMHLGLPTLASQSFLTDAAISAIGFALGLVAMRMIAGPARSDALARVRQIPKLP